VLQLIKLIELGNIKYLIYSTQYYDFKKSVLKNIDENEVKKYLNNQFTLYPYITTIKGLGNNLSNNIRYRSIYFNPNKYTYLNFDRTGSVNFTFNPEFIEQSRWGSKYKKKYNLSSQCFEDLIELNQISKNHDIKLIVITTPMRETILHGNRDLLNIFNEYTNKLKYLSNRYGFTYINTHKILNLSDKYFVDKTHLNTDGATLVSREIIKQLL
jgi:hypothetical protein